MLDYGDVLYMHASPQSLHVLYTVYHGTLRFIMDFKALTHYCVNVSVGPLRMQGAGWLFDVSQIIRITFHVLGLYACICMLIVVLLLS